MSNDVYEQPAPQTEAARPTIMARARRAVFLHNVGNAGFVAFSVLGFAFLWAPIIMLVFFSFNDSRFVNEWQGFTFDWYENIFNDIAGTEARFSTALMLDSVKNSLIVSLSATFIATVIGTMVALSLARGTFPGKKLFDGVLLLPIVIPEITQGISLAMFFMIVFDYLERISGAQANFGFTTIIIAHVVFNISYVAVVVRARLAGMNPRLEEAARDLGANGWQAFWHITFPQIIPGIIAGALLAFTLSLDDYVVTFFNNGVGTTTLPIFVYGMLKTAVTPEINAISTLMLVASTFLIGVSLILQRRSFSQT
jgi:spermidine/putrescine transport system permease protein